MCSSLAPERFGRIEFIFGIQDMSTIHHRTVSDEPENFRTKKNRPYDRPLNTYYDILKKCS